MSLAAAAICALLPPDPVQSSLVGMHQQLAAAAASAPRAPTPEPGAPPAVASSRTEVDRHGHHVNRNQLRRALQGRCPQHTHADGTGCACDCGYVVSAAGDACELQRPPPPPPTPPPPTTGKIQQFTVASGPCTLDMGGRCVGRRRGYSVSEVCVISSHAIATLGPCPVFDTEATYDYLMIDDERTGYAPGGLVVVH